MRADAQRCLFKPIGMWLSASIGLATYILNIYKEIYMYFCVHFPLAGQSIKAASPCVSLSLFLCCCFHRKIFASVLCFSILTRMANKLQLNATNMQQLCTAPLGGCLLSTTSRTNSSDNIISWPHPLPSHPIRPDSMPKPRPTPRPYCQCDPLSLILEPLFRCSIRLWCLKWVWRPIDTLHFCLLSVKNDL